MKTVYDRAEAVPFIDPKIWNIVPSEIKEKHSSAAFKNVIKTWKPSNYPYRLHILPGLDLFDL